MVVVPLSAHNSAAVVVVFAVDMFVERRHRRAVTLPIMSATVRIPTTLRTLTAGAGEVSVEATTVAEVFEALEATHPGFKERLLDEDGNLRRFVNVFVSDEDVRFIDGLSTTVPDGETVSIVPAVAGG
jgi:molybdopterin synthase sulfur carrier subunit